MYNDEYLCEHHESYQSGQVTAASLTESHVVACKFLLVSAAMSGFMLGCTIMIWYQLLT